MAIAVPANVRADPPAHSNAGGTGNGSENGNGPGSNSGSGPGSNSGNGNGAGHSNAGGNGAGQGHGSGPRDANKGPEVTIPDHEVARRAVESGAAKPLSEIIASAGTVAPGNILDAELVTVNGFLLYRVKVFQGGEVKNLYFYAKSGLPVRGQ